MVRQASPDRYFTRGFKMSPHEAHQADVDRIQDKESNASPRASLHDRSLPRRSARWPQCRGARRGKVFGSKEMATLDQSSTVPRFFMSTQEAAPKASPIYHDQVEVVRLGRRRLLAARGSACLCLTQRASLPPPPRSGPCPQRAARTWTRRSACVVASRLMISKSRMSIAAASTHEGSSCAQ